jgi:hypothetical protein
MDVAVEDVLLEHLPTQQDISLDLANLLHAAIARAKQPQTIEAYSLFRSSQRFINECWFFLSTMICRSCNASSATRTVVPNQMVLI